jgi:hypothetical protein
MCVTGSLSGSLFSFDEKRLIVLAKYDDKTLGTSCQRILLSWSNGKDSAWALPVLRKKHGV